MLPHSLTNLEVEKHNQNKPNGFYSRYNLPKIKHREYVINLDKYQSIGTHWIALYVNGNNRRASYDAIYFDSFEVVHIPTEIKKFIRNKNIITNICWIQAYSSIMCGYFCIGFIDFMLKGKSLFDYANFFSRNDYEKNDKIINYTSIAKKMKKLYDVICSNYRKIEKTKTSYLLAKRSVLSIICSRCKNENQKLFKEGASTEILKNFGLIENI